MFALFALLSVAIGDGRREGQGEIETGDRKSSMLVIKCIVIRLVKVSELGG